MWGLYYIYGMFWQQWRNKDAQSGVEFTNKYSDVIMSAMESQISGVPIVNSTVCSGAHKKTSKLRVTGLYEGNSPVTGEVTSQRASNAAKPSIWWRHHAIFLSNSTHNDRNFYVDSLLKTYHNDTTLPGKLASESPRLFLAIISLGNNISIDYYIMLYNYFDIFALIRCAKFSYWSWRNSTVNVLW